MLRNVIEATDKATHQPADRTGAPEPPTTATGYLVWIARRHTLAVVGALSALLASSAAWALVPWSIARVVDQALLAESGLALARWTAILAGAAIAATGMYIVGYRLMFSAEARVRRATVEHIGAHLNRVGTAVRGKVVPGEMVSLSTDDTHRTASFVFQLGLSWRSLCVFVIAIWLLWGIHPVLCLVAGGGSLVIGTFAGPLLGKLYHRESTYRERYAELAGQSVDLVGGLRVLRGIGGEAWFADRYRKGSQGLRTAGYRVADVDSWIQAIQISLPLGLVAVTTWVAARMAVAGTITTGELSAAFGFAALLAGHAGFIIDSAQAFVSARVAAGKLVSFFRLTPEVAAGTGRAAGGDLADPDTGLRFAVGRLTVVAAERTAEAIDLAERLTAHRPSGARWGEQAMADLDRSDLRARIVLLHRDYLFAQSLGRTLRTDPVKATAALHVAAAQDVYNSLSGDLDGMVADAGRNLSGGQRQRLRLARSVAAEPEVLVAVEPTSAVDAHTESSIAERLAVARDGLTTVVVTTSPLWLARADTVVWLRSGAAHVVGDYRELLERSGFLNLIRPTRSLQGGR